MISWEMGFTALKGSKNTTFKSVWLVLFPKQIVSGVVRSPILALKDS
jgi:hypothetical protein